jgi:hypothetical protein
VILFSGSKAHAGAAYNTSNRRLHIYFFSTNCKNILPVEDEDDRNRLIRQLLDDSTSETDKIKIQFAVMHNLEVYDFDTDEGDFFAEK